MDCINPAAAKKHDLCTKISRYLHRKLNLKEIFACNNDPMRCAKENVTQCKHFFCSMLYVTAMLL